MFRHGGCANPSRGGSSAGLHRPLPCRGPRTYGEVTGGDPHPGRGPFDEKSPIRSSGRAAGRGRRHRWCSSRRRRRTHCSALALQGDREPRHGGQSRRPHPVDDARGQRGHGGDLHRRRPQRHAVAPHPARHLPHLRDRRRGRVCLLLLELRRRRDDAAGAHDHHHRGPVDDVHGAEQRDPEQPHARQERAGRRRGPVGVDAAGPGTVDHRGGRRIRCGAEPASADRHLHVERIGRTGELRAGAVDLRAAGSDDRRGHRRSRGR